MCASYARRCSGAGRLSPMARPLRVRSLSPGNVLLLHAALDDGPTAIRSWKEWFAQAGSLDDGIDYGEFRLLPLVYRNLRSHGFADSADLGRLQGIYRQTWYRNRLAEARFFEALDILTAEGIDVLALKGMALIGLAYGESGLRPMNDVDLLVHGRDMRRALDLLQSNGWTLAQARPGEELTFARLFHAVSVRHPRGGELDVHRHILEESNWPRADVEVWERSRDVELSGRTVRTMDPADHLLHVIVHGMRWDPIPPIRWIPDAILLMRTQSIDWDLLVAEASRRGVVLATREALAYLVDEFAGPVPEVVLTSLGALPASRLERFDFAFEQGGPSPREQVVRYVSRYLRMTSGRGPLDRFRLFPVYLRAMWGLDSLWQIPRDGLRRTWTRARGGDPGRVRTGH